MSMVEKPSVVCQCASTALVLVAYAFLLRRSQPSPQLSTKRYDHQTYFMIAFHPQKVQTREFAGTS